MCGHYNDNPFYRTTLHDRVTKAIVSSATAGNYWYFILSHSIQSSYLLALLRTSVTADSDAPVGEIARRMYDAVNAHLKRGFVTPMAAVAGAVGDEVLRSMTQAASLTRAYVNNGGDIALHLAKDAKFSVGMAGLDGAALGQITLDADSPVRGIASSGQGGRSLSFGIADSVTVLARSACAADVAATLIAGAVDLADHPSIKRVPAQSLREESDLAARLVVHHVGALCEGEIANALEAGANRARKMQENGLVCAASLHLRGASRQIELNTRKVLDHA